MKVILICVTGLILSLALVSNTRANANAIATNVNHTAVITNASAENIRASRVHAGITKRAQEYMSLQQMTDVFVGPTTNPCDRTLTLTHKPTTVYPCRPIIEMK